MWRSGTPVPLLPYRRGSVRRLAALVPFAILVLLLPAQEPTPPPRMVIRTESRVVLADAVVRDKKGRLVRDLGASDFELWEDGKPQAITSFSVERAGEGQKTQKHYLLMLFDGTSGSRAELMAARRDATKFVNAWAGPDRYMGVVTFTGELEIAQNLTLNPASLVSAINSIRDLPDPTVVPTFDSSQSRSTSVGRGADLGNPPPTNNTRTPNTTTASQTAAQPPENSAFLRRGLLEAVREIAGSMASIRGRKSLALIGFGGPDTTESSSLSAAIAACNRANVAVYVMNQPGLKSLASETGGRVLANANNLAAELGQVAEDQDEHYILGYTPTESVHDCHTLRVAVKRSGMDVRARQGYCNTKPVEALPADTGKAVETRAASQAGNMTASMQLPYFYAAPNIAKVSVAMEIAASALPFSKVKGKPHAELTVVGIANKADGEVGARFSDLVNLDFESEKEVEAFRKRPFHYEYQFDMPPGAYRLRVAFSAGAQNFGKAEAPLTIDPWDGRSFSMSTLALAKESRPVADLASTLDDSLLEDRRPLIARSVQIVPSGSNRFRPGEPCRWYAEIYGAPANGPAPTVQFRVLDRTTGRQQTDSGVIGVAEFVRPGSALIPVALDVPVHQLAAGSYRLEVKAVHPTSAASVLRTIDFEVEK